MKVKTDLHIHSVLSACADDDNTPDNIVNLCEMLSVKVIALADHNSVLNYPALDALASTRGILTIPAMEVTTQEDIHILCLFEDYNCALRVQEIIWQGLPRIKLDQRIYLPQRVVNQDGEVVKILPDLLNVACALNVYQLADLVKEHKGICIPAHVDKTGAMLDVLGEIPQDLRYTTVEVSRNCPDGIVSTLSRDYTLLYTSDAHDLETLCLSGSELELDDLSVVGVLHALGRV